MVFERFRQYGNYLSLREKKLRLIVICAGELFSLFTLIYKLVRRDYIHMEMCVGIFFMVLIPPVTEAVFSCKMRSSVFIAATLYALSPMLGECYKLYYITSWWDKLLHTFGGIAFAFFGVFLFKKLCGNNVRKLAVALFAVCFSMSLSVMWEFVEYTSDNLLDTDMQHDTVIQELHSYALTDGAPDTEKHISDIHDTAVNGQKLPVKGYLDIGLHDTMQDMLTETAGAVLGALLYLLNRDKLKLIIPYDNLSAIQGG